MAVAIPVEDRFWAKVAVEGSDECWPWVGSRSASGYGTFFIQEAPRIDALAHRYSYELLIGPIPEGLHIDHLCRNRACVNPAHLEPVTPAENNRRAGAAKTHCSAGHLYDEANTYRRPGRGERQCRLCRQRHMQAFRIREDIR